MGEVFTLLSRVFGVSDLSLKEGADLCSSDPLPAPSRPPRGSPLVLSASRALRPAPDPNGGLRVAGRRGVDYWGAATCGTTSCTGATRPSLSTPRIPTRWCSS